jgi:hypothetical protein
LCLVFLVVLFAGCKKDKDRDTGQPVIKTDWTTELKNSVWSGEMQLTDGVILNPQYCSIVFGNDNTVRIHEIRSIHLGTWSVVDSSITMDFNGTIIKAEVGKQNWKAVQALPTNSFNLFSAIRSAEIDPVKIVGTVWKGAFFGKNLQLEFLAGKNIKITHPDVNGGTPVTTPYSVSGSGVLFTATPYTGVTLGMSLYGVLYNGDTEFRGINYAIGFPFTLYWKVIKQ